MFIQIERKRFLGDISDCYREAVFGIAWHGTTKHDMKIIQKLGV